MRSRGSWEPCGLKFTKENVYQPANYVEARESLVDWNITKLVCCSPDVSRGSWEPCGLKLDKPKLNRKKFIVEARESLVDWNRCNFCGTTEGVQSRLVRALWIEIICALTFPSSASRRGSWEPCGLKSDAVLLNPCSRTSRLVRALWIEIHDRKACRKLSFVEARESLVDWNLSF